MQSFMQRVALTSGLSSTMKPLRFGIWTAVSELASITASAGTTDRAPAIGSACHFRP
jgi:hypothetical protein